MRRVVFVLDSSPWKSWSENNDSFDGSGLSTEPEGPGDGPAGDGGRAPRGDAAVLWKKRQTKKQTGSFLALRW